MKKAAGREEGLLSLEACIAVTIFLFLMLFMYSFFVFFEARNVIAHGVLSAADSLSLDAYGNTAIAGSNTVLAVPGAAKTILEGLYGVHISDDSDFVDNGMWYKSSAVNVTNADGSTTVSSAFLELVKERFLAYISGGDREKANDLLKRLHIRGGADGLDFSNSRVEGGNLYLSVRYTIDYEYQMFGQGGLNMEQKACSKFWGKTETD